MVHDHLNKLSITFQQWDQCEIWWQMVKGFLKNHDFIHVNSSVAGKYNKHKQDGSHLRFPIRMILASVDLQVTSILPMNFESIALSVQEKKLKQIFKMDAIASIWDFLSQRFGLFFIYKSPQCFLPSFESISLSVQKKKGKIDFQDGHHLGFPIGTILAIFMSTSHPDQFPTNFQMNWHLVQENKRRNEFQDGRYGGHLGFPIQTI